MARFGSGDLKHRIALNRKDELGELAKSVNTMADEIQEMLEAKRQLLLAISHELRSPLTRARLNAELLANTEPRERIIQDLQILEQQLSELLETEQLDSKHAKLDLQPVDPFQLIKSVTKEHFPSEHWRRIRTNNPLERILREVRRRTRVVGAFPDGNSALMLVAARLRHIAGTKWGTRRYLNMKLLKIMESEENLAA